VASAILALSSGAAAQSQSSSQPTEARVQELIRLAAERAGVKQAGGGTPSPQQPAASGQPDHPTVQLTLEDAVKLALDRNLDIAVQRLTPETYDYSLASLKAVYKPALTSQLATQSTTNPATSTIAGGATAGAPVVSGASTFNGGVTQNLPWGGGGATILLNNNRTTTTSTNTLYNPQYNTNWSAQYTQPLFRGLRIDSTRQQIVVTKLNQDISELQLQATITNTVSNVRNAYWDYVFAVQSVDVAKQSVDLADQLVKDNQTRVEVGTMAPIDVVQAQSQAATARQNLVTAQAAVKTAELALKRLIVGGTQDPNWNATLDPIDRPDFRPEAIDLATAVRRGLDVRTDLQQAKKNLAINDATLKFLRDQTLPQVDLTARYGLIGVGGTQLIKTGSGIIGASNPTVITGTIPGGYSNALNQLFGAGYPAWNLTLNFSYPLGMSTAEAAVARSKIQVAQTQAQVNQVELQIATDVTNAVVTVQSNVERVQAAQAARELAEKTMDAEKSKFEVGMSTNYNVILTQRDLATAQNNELQAILAYRKSIVELDRLQQTTLQNVSITILGTGGLNSAAIGSGRPTVVAGGQ
jgi:outer membrane protein TolC